MNAIPLEEDIHYPESDGQPMGETETHCDEMADLIAQLQDWFRDAADVHVGGNMFFYYVKGDPKSVFCPDVYVIRGSDKRRRRIYKMWEEGVAPSLIVELTSADTRRTDLVRKKELYQRLGVEDYFIYDPLEEYLRPSLQGFHLEGGRYRPLQPDEEGALWSAVAGLKLRREDGHLRLIDPATRKRLLRIEEAQREAREKSALEAEVDRLRRELEDLRGRSGAQ